MARYNDKALVVESVHSPRCFIEIEDWYKGVRPETVALEAVRGSGCWPSRPSATLLPLSRQSPISGRNCDAVRYPDHHDYTMAEMQGIMQKAVDKEVCALVTTEKDAVKIPSEFIHSDRPLPVYVLSIEVKFIDGGSSGKFRS